ASRKSVRPAPPHSYSPPMPPTLPAPTTDPAPVSALLDDALRRVETIFDHALQSDLPPVQRLVAHLETYRGKMLRPALVILCAQAADPCLAASASPTSSLGHFVTPSLPILTIAA